MVHSGSPRRFDKAELKTLYAYRRGLPPAVAARVRYEYRRNHPLTFIGLLAALLLVIGGALVDALGWAEVLREQPWGIDLMLIGLVTGGSWALYDARRGVGLGPVGGLLLSSSLVIAMALILFAL